MIKTVFFSFVTLLISTLFTVGCVSSQPTPISQKTNAELIQLLETFEHKYEEASEYPFYEIVSELEKRGASASEAAPVLARMIAFDGSTSVTASHPLIAMEAAAKPAIPYLLGNLNNPREDVRRYSIFVLGTIGEPARCSTPYIAPLLWDEDPYVRSATSGAITEITSIMLVESELYKLDPSIPGSVPADGEDFKISQMARDWWLETGQYSDWPNENCELQE